MHSSFYYVCIHQQRISSVAVRADNVVDCRCKVCVQGNTVDA